MVVRAAASARRRLREKGKGSTSLGRSVLRRHLAGTPGARGTAQASGAGPAGAMGRASGHGPTMVRPSPGTAGCGGRGPERRTGAAYGQPMVAVSPVGPNPVSTFWSTSFHGFACVTGSRVSTLVASWFASVWVPVPPCSIRSTSYSNG